MGVASRLAPDLWIKDEGAFGDGGWGGNKVRKLEFTLADAIERGKRTVLTLGGFATNHGLATALYARDNGLACVLALVAQPIDDHVREMSARIDASGASVHRYRSKFELALALPLLVLRHRPYILPVGGSTPLGVLGAVECGREIASQLPQVAHVVVAAGSGGTAAGLLVGLARAGSPASVTAVLVNDKTPLDHARVMRLARRTAALLDRAPELDPAALRWETAWLGDGYGHETLEGVAAAELTEHHTGIELEQVYTAKAMAALLALRERGGLQGPTVFLQTNGPRPVAAAGA